MENKLRSFLEESNNRDTATAYGTNVHNRLQNVRLENTDDEWVAQILANPDLARLFDAHSQAEVPIAGRINGRFVSRRIDRLRIDTDLKTIDILDYKTDTNHDERRAHYIAQLGEYKKLMSEMHPDFKITCYILWTHDWTLERI